MQLFVDLVEIREQTGGVARDGRREEQLFQGLVGEPLRERPGEPGHPDTLQILADRTAADAATLADVPIAAATFVFQS